jgi:hypothetical protein
VPPGDADDPVRVTFVEAAEADPDRYVLCHDPAPEKLPDEVLARLARLIATRRSALTSH